MLKGNFAKNLESNFETHDQIQNSKFVLLCFKIFSEAPFDLTIAEPIVVSFHARSTGEGVTGLQGL